MSCSSSDRPRGRVDALLLLLPVRAEDEGGGERELHLPGHEPAQQASDEAHYDDDDDDDDEQGGGGGAAQLHGVRGPGRGGAWGGGGAGARLLRPLQRRRVPQLHRGQGPRLVQHQVRRC